ncbi:MAG: hypothetical protein QXF22_06230 [Thermoplasmata archaeon]
MFYFTPNKNSAKLEDCFIFAINQTVTMDNVSNLANLYRMRCGIETRCKEKKEVRGKT